MMSDIGMKREVLDVANHDRDVAGMRYVYPVVSRRAGGVSVGINLNPNNACNWHCAYCQVPNLVRGSAPGIDGEQLERELTTMLAAITEGDFLAEHVPPDMRRLCDVAISGKGEPTSCRDFDGIVQGIIDVMHRFDVRVPLRLITNGSYMGKARVQHALKCMQAAGGEVWIKVDAADADAIRRINGVRLDAERLYEQVRQAAELCPTWIQTCMITWDGALPPAHEIDAYLALLRRFRQTGVPLRGVLLYGLARPSMQREAMHVRAPDAAWMQKLARQIEATGISVQLSH